MILNNNFFTRNTRFTEIHMYIYISEAMNSVANVHIFIYNIIPVELFN